MKINMVPIRRYTYKCKQIESVWKSRKDDLI